MIHGTRTRTVRHSVGLWRGHTRRARGFTLIELMVTITIMAVLLAIVVPSFNDALLSGKLGTLANELASSATLARSEAVKRNVPITLCVSSNGTSCGTGDWEQGWIVAVGGTVLQRQNALPSGFKVTESGSSLTSLSFQPTGVGSTMATFVICRAAPSVGAQEREVAISATGMVSVSKTTNGSCP